MPTGFDPTVNYTATALLVLMFLGLARVGTRLVNRAEKSFDKLDLAVDGIKSMGAASELAAERRHAETRAAIEAAAKTTRHELRSALQLQQASLELRMFEWAERRPTQAESKALQEQLIRLSARDLSKEDAHDASHAT